MPTKAQDNVHDGHVYNSLNEVSEICRKKLSNELVSLQELQERISVALNKLPKAKAEKEAAERMYQEVIDESFEALFFTLHQEKTALMSSLSQLFSQEFEVLAVQKNLWKKLTKKYDGLLPLSRQSVKEAMSSYLQVLKQWSEMLSGYSRKLNSTIFFTM